MTPNIQVSFPIRAKLLLLMIGLVLSSTVIYLALAIQLFRNDKTQLVYELNGSTVKTLAAETHFYLQKVADKAKLLTEGHTDSTWTNAVLSAEPDLISYTLYRPAEQAGRWTIVSNVSNSEYFRRYGDTSSNPVEKIRVAFPLPFAEILRLKTWASNSTLPDGAPVLTYANAYEAQGGNYAGQKLIAVLDIRLDHLLKSVTEASTRGIVRSFIINREGMVLAHPDPELVSKHVNLGEQPLVREALEANVTFQMKRYTWQGKDWLGAFASAEIAGIKVISQVEDTEAFRAAHHLIVKSILFGLIVITASALISLWFARSLIAPIELLLMATDRLSRWEFKDSIHVKTRDEVGYLARAFNSMASDLQNQRQALDQSQAELELKVQERTLKLESQKRQMSEIQDSLMKTTRLASLGELAGSAAHEVLNPLNNINIRVERMNQQLQGIEVSDAKLLGDIVEGWGKAYKDGGFSSLQKELEQIKDAKPLVEEDLENLTSIAGELQARNKSRQEDMQFLGREINRIVKIVNSMRALSRVGGERRPLDVHLALEDTMASLRDYYQQRGVALLSEYSAEPREMFTMIGDKDELVQVFSNLLKNALQAVLGVERRNGSVRVKTSRNGAKIEVRIIDNGSGISPDNLLKIFEPNFTTKSGSEGTGLGLSISRRLVRAFGGDIEIEQTVELSGTTFLIWFPATT